MSFILISYNTGPEVNYYHSVKTWEMLTKMECAKNQFPKKMYGVPTKHRMTNLSLLKLYSLLHLL